MNEVIKENLQTTLTEQEREDAARWRRLQKNPFAAIDALQAECEAKDNSREWASQSNSALDALRRQQGETKSQFMP